MRPIGTNSSYAAAGRDTLLLFVGLPLLLAIGGMFVAGGEQTQERLVDIYQRRTAPEYRAWAVAQQAGQQYQPKLEKPAPARTSLVAVNVAPPPISATAYLPADELTTEQATEAVTDQPTVPTNTARRAEW